MPRKRANIFRQIHKLFGSLPALGPLLCDGGSTLEGPLRRIVEGPSVRFEIPAINGVSGKDVQSHLERYGVTMYWYHATGRSIVFRVREAQAQWTEYLLEKAGWA